MQGNYRIHDRVVQGPGGPGRTHQSFRDECNINSIMAKWQKMGAFEHVSKSRAVYGDFSEGLDYQAALQKVADVDDAFQELPSAVRSRLENNPGKLIDFLNDPANLDEAVQLGLVELSPEPVEPAPPAPPEPDPTPPA